MTLVSVVIPTYQRNAILFSRALPSVLRQTHTELDINIVSDGMRGEMLDDLMDRADALADKRVRIWSVPRPEYPKDPGQFWGVQGINARNFGLDHADGEWIAPLDDDDEWTDDHVAVLLTAAEREGVQFAYGISQYHWPNNHQQHAGKWPPGMGSFCDGAQVYRADLGYRYDPQCLERGLPADGDLWTRMYAGGVTFTFVKRLVHHYYPAER